MKARPPLAVSSSSYVHPGQNGVVTVPSFDTTGSVQATSSVAAVAVPIAQRCGAYTPLPAVQYISTPVCSLFYTVSLLFIGLHD